MLTDFGVSKIIENTIHGTTVIGTHLYHAPEIKRHAIKSYELCDSFSLGLTFLRTCLLFDIDYLITIIGNNNEEKLK